MEVAMFMPAGACKYLAYLWLSIAQFWPTMSDPAVLAGLVQSESCIHIKHKRCWNPHSTLKTKREYGFGFGQVTIAYRPDGSVRFNVWAELRKKYKTHLKKWTWENRFDPEMQLRAIVLMTNYGYNKYPMAHNEEQRLKFMLAGYNGGDASVMKDMGLCRRIKGCDPTKWDGNVALHSYKSKKPWKGYGNRSPFTINRQYPPKVFEASNRYRNYLPIDEILEKSKHNDYNVCK